MAQHGVNTRYFSLQMGIRQQPVGTLDAVLFECFRKDPSADTGDRSGISMQKAAHTAEHAFYAFYS